MYLPEAAFDLESESDRLKAVMDTVGNVTIFLSEGAGLESIVAEMEQSGAEVPRDPFGHVKIDEVNPGQWFAKQFAARLGAEKVLVQKSGYFARSAPADETDLMLIKQMTDYAVGCALRGSPAWSGMTRRMATSCGRSSSTGSRAARSSTSTEPCTSSCCPGSASRKRAAEPVTDTAGVDKGPPHRSRRRQRRPRAAGWSGDRNSADHSCRCAT